MTTAEINSFDETLDRFSHSNGGQAARILAELDELLADLGADERNEDELGIDWEKDFPCIGPDDRAHDFDKSLNAASTSSTAPTTPQTPAAHGIAARAGTSENTPQKAVSVIKETPSSSPTPNPNPSKTKREARKWENRIKRSRVEAARFKHEKQASEDLVDTSPSRRTLPRWRALGPNDLARAAFDFLASQGPVFGFSLELDDATIAKATASGSITRYMQAEITRQLKRRFPGRRISFVVMKEIRTSTGDRPHLHGLVIMDSDDRPLVEEAFLAAGGRHWKQKRRGDRQLAFSDKPADEHWLSRYASKSVDYTRANSPGAVIACPRHVGVGAKACFEAWRAREAKHISGKRIVINDLSLSEACAVAKNPLDSEPGICEEIVAADPQGVSKHDNDFKAGLPARASDVSCAGAIRGRLERHSGRGERGRSTDGSTGSRRAHSGARPALRRVERRDCARRPPGRARLLRSSYADPKSVGLMTTRFKIEGDPNGHQFE